MRALLPDRDGYADCAGLKVFYEVFGEDNDPTVVLVHGWQICPSLLWKMQVPYLARHFRVVTFDWPGNGRSDRPTTAHEFGAAAGMLPSVLEATGTARAVFVGHSGGTFVSLMQAIAHPDSVLGLVLIGGGALTLEEVESGEIIAEAWREGWTRFDDDHETHERWHKLNRRYWQDNFRDFAEFFMDENWPEPHSTKLIEDGISWASEATQDSLMASVAALGATTTEGFMAAMGMIAAAAPGIGKPTLIIHGSLDTLAPYQWGVALAGIMGADLLTIEGAGHSPHARDPVPVNLAIKGLVDRVQPPPPVRRTFTRAAVRPKRALFVCSPIGLGHALRDVAIAAELRKIHPDLEIHWLAQHPVTELLRVRGETIHPASAHLASESAHWESEADEHDLHCFQALRRMDEILVANFMTFHDVVTDTPYDAWICDEAWDVDHFLHENPELKRSALAWLTDFVGFLPMSDDERRLTADYNAEMIELVERSPRLRDRALFVGDADDIVPDGFGDGLPAIRDWTCERFAFPGYITGFEPVDREGVRASLGWESDDKVCIVAVGGSGVGTHLLRRVVAAAPKLDGVRMVAVAGPRIDPASIEAPAGVDVLGYVPDLYRLLAACDVAVVQGGLTTCMELAAARRPFLYVPLRDHFEQNFHVRHRLERYGAGRCTTYEEASDPDGLAEAIRRDMARSCEYLPVAADGAARAAAMIGELL
jgi:pimeloyl-ACP methyl ester carboxylesterase/predicted glycosyltransferase